MILKYNYLDYIQDGILFFLKYLSLMSSPLKIINQNNNLIFAISNLACVLLILSLNSFYFILFIL